MHSMRAQEATVLDLSEIRQRTNLRVSQAKEPNCAPAPCVVVKGRAAAHCTTALSGLRVVLERVTPASITLDPFTAEFRVLNTGPGSVEIPISLDLTDLQPPGPLQEFDYFSIALRIRLDSVRSPQAFGLGWIELYGSSKRPKTLLELRPGHWVRVIANVKMHTWPTQPVDALLRGDFSMHKNVFKPEEHGGSVDALDLCPDRVALPHAVEVHFSPIHQASEP